jgi:uncharacterized protein
MGEPSVLDRLVVNVCHDCNLRCRYCYAEGGSYGGSRDVLTAEAAHAIVDYFFSIFDTIRSVQFFGGEPFLVPDVLEATCELIARRCAREGRPRPRFSVVTNGTLIDKRALAIIRDHELAVTVSLDGPAPIHDALRVATGGGGTFASVVAGIAAMKEATGQPNQVEATFTAVHLWNDFSLVEFMDFLARELDVHALHMPWILGERCNGNGVAATDTNLAALERVFGEGIDRAFRSLAGPEIDDAIVLSLVDRRLQARLTDRRPSRSVCGAGSGTIAVGADGAIYPCFMFVNQGGFRLGEVGTTEPEALEARRRAFARRLELAPGTPEPLMGCAGVWHEQTGEPDRCLEAEAWLGQRLAARIDAHIEAARADPDAWEGLQVKARLIGALFS